MNELTFTIERTFLICNIVFSSKEKATSSQSLMIIRCCGDLVPSETPENRTKMVQEVLKTMENLSKFLVFEFGFKLS